MSDEKRVFYDTKGPRNGAPSGCETVPDPDSRVWETPCTPQQHATPTQGSVHGEGSFLDSRNAKEPVAWAVAGDNGDYAAKLCFDEASAVLEADRRCMVGLRLDYVVVPLYRHPQPVLTDEEREAVEWVAGAAWYAPTISATLRGLLERLA